MLGIVVWRRRLFVIDPNTNVNRVALKHFCGTVAMAPELCSELGKFAGEAQRTLAAFDLCWLYVVVFLVAVMGQHTCTNGASLCATPCADSRLRFCPLFDNRLDSWWPVEPAISPAPHRP